MATIMAIVYIPIDMLINILNSIFRPNAPIANNPAQTQVKKWGGETL